MALQYFATASTRNILVRFGVLIGLLSTTTPVSAAGPAAVAKDFTSRIQLLSEGAPTLAPFAHVKFCITHSDQCVASGGSSTVQLNREKLHQLVRVNAHVNRSILPKPDRSSQDDWSVDVARGDCEDYVLTKRKQLMRLGWSSSALRVAVATTRAGEGHAVLVVKTSKGDVVLDNRFNDIKDWRETDLQWIKIQSGQNPKLWFELKRRNSVPVEMVSSTSRKQASQQFGDESVSRGDGAVSDVDKAFVAQASSTITIKSGSILRVRDSAAFDFRGDRYRLAAVAATDRNALCRNVSGRPYACGLRGVKVLSNLLRSGTVVCRIEPPRKGIRMAHCKSNDVDLSELIATAL